LLAAHLGDLAKGIFVLERLNPEGAEAGRDVLNQALDK
jgi:hypothetical protein